MLCTLYECGGDRLVLYHFSVFDVVRCEIVTVVLYRLHVVRVIISSWCHIFCRIIYDLLWTIVVFLLSPKIPHKINVCSLSAITISCVRMPVVYICISLNVRVLFSLSTMYYTRLFRTYVIYMQISCYILFIGFSCWMQKKQQLASKVIEKISVFIIILYIPKLSYVPSPYCKIWIGTHIYDIMILRALLPHTQPHLIDIHIGIYMCAKSYPEAITIL